MREVEVGGDRRHVKEGGGVFLGEQRRGVGKIDGDRKGVARVGCGTVSVRLKGFVGRWMMNAVEADMNGEVYHRIPHPDLFDLRLHPLWPRRRWK